MASLPKPDDRIEILGIELRWKLRRADTFDQYCLLEVTMPPGAGVPLHQHPQQEAFYILEGNPAFGLDHGAGVVWKEMNPGELLNIPPDRTHGFRNGTDRAVKYLVTCQGDLGKFFEEAGTPLVGSEAPSSDLSPEAIHRVIEIAMKHGQRFPELNDDQPPHPATPDRTSVRTASPGPV